MTSLTKLIKAMSIIRSYMWWNSVEVRSWISPIYYWPCSQILAINTPAEEIIIGVKVSSRLTYQGIADVDLLANVKYLLRAFHNSDEQSL